MLDPTYAAILWPGLPLGGRVSSQSDKFSDRHRSPEPSKALTDVVAGRRRSHTTKSLLSYRQPVRSGTMNEHIQESLRENPIERPGLGTSQSLYTLQACGSGCHRLSL